MPRLKTQITATLALAATCIAGPPPGINVPAYAPFAQRDPLPMIIRSSVAQASGKLEAPGFDTTTYRVFLPAPRQNAVYVQDLATHKVLQQLAPLPEPRAVLWLDAPQRLLIACGGDGSLRIYKPTDPQPTPPPSPATPAPTDLYAQEHSIDLPGEAVALAFDPDPVSPLRGTIYTAHGQSITPIDLSTAKTGKAIDLPGRAESIALADSQAGKRLIVNIPRPERTADKPEPKPLVIALNPATGETLWSTELQDTRQNIAIAIDNESDRVFVLARNPARVLVLDGFSGLEVTRFDCPDDAASISYDPLLQRLFITGGGNDGKLAVFQRRGVGAPLDKQVDKQVDKPAENQADKQPQGIDTYALVHTASTNAGCRTAHLSTSERLLIAAAPAIDGNPTFLYIYLIGP